jgi:hypothetical protein
VFIVGIQVERLVDLVADREAQRGTHGTPERHAAECSAGGGGRGRGSGGGGGGGLVGVGIGVGVGVGRHAILEQHVIVVVLVLIGATGPSTSLLGDLGGALGRRCDQRSHHTVVIAQTRCRGVRGSLAVGVDVASSGRERHCITVLLHLDCIGEELFVVGVARVLPGALTSLEVEIVYLSA